MRRRSLAQRCNRSQPSPRAGSSLKVARPVTAIIESVGAKGDGIAKLDGKLVHVPFALPGETVRVDPSRGELGSIAVESSSSDRVAPVCRHFGACGGCALQHWTEERYIEWKENLVRSSMARAGIDAPPIERLRTYPLEGRRRAAFGLRSAGGIVELGYMGSRANTFVGLQECPILHPAIVAAIPKLAAALKGVPTGSRTKVHITLAANGLDCRIEAAPPRTTNQAQLAARLHSAGVLRATWNDDILTVAEVPFVLFGDVKVTLPPSAFLQAVEACERDIAAFVRAELSEAVSKGEPVCDLFSGLGSFTFPTAKDFPVTAYETNSHAVAALAQAARVASGIKPVRAIRRDLFRNPLSPLELNKFAAVTMNPPREGAQAQCLSLASSKIDVIVMISCNATTFARDAALLTAGGFQLTRVALFDQFKFSVHVEIAAAFRRLKNKRAGLRPPPITETS
jgi:23S rRNA (uracil1939-C5)-methyltransferase